MYAYMAGLTHRTQILLDDERHERLRRRAAETGRSVGALIREAIDRGLPDAPPDRSRAASILLEAEPMAVGDWTEMKREMLDQIYGRGAGSS